MRRHSHKLSRNNDNAWQCSPTLRGRRGWVFVSLAFCASVIFMLIFAVFWRSPQQQRSVWGGMGFGKQVYSNTDDAERTSANNQYSGTDVLVFERQHQTSQEKVSRILYHSSIELNKAQDGTAIVSLDTQKRALYRQKRAALASLNSDVLADAVLNLAAREAVLNERVERLEPWERCLRFEYRKGGECEEYDNKDNSKPPCVLDILREMGAALTSELEAVGVTHWISYGSLLGAVREKRVLRWTQDVDVVIPTEEYATMGSKIEAAGKFEAHGFHFFYDKKYPDIGRACVTEAAGERYTKWEKSEPEVLHYYNHYPYIDLYSTHENTAEARQNNGPVRVRFGPSCTFRADTIFPLSKVRLYDRDVFAPHNTTRYLTQLYGPDFMKPPDRRLRSGHGGYSDACKPEWQKL